METETTVLDELRRQAEIIRDETKDAANTAQRVGQLLIDIIQNTAANQDALDDRYLLKFGPDDTEAGSITFKKDIYVNGVASLTETLVGQSIYSNKNGADYDENGFYLGADGNLWISNEYVKNNAYFNDSLSSPIFTSGFPEGYGWKLGPYERLNAAEVIEKKYRLEIDDITVRGKLRVFEFIISQLRGENDNVIFAGQMKVDCIDTETNTIYLDTEEGLVYNPFREGDILMMQRFNGLPTASNGFNVIKQYELQVTEAAVASLANGRYRVDYIRFKNFVGDLRDVAFGDVLTRVDNVLDSTRKGIIKVTTIDEWGSPYIDVVYGLKTDPQIAVKSRIGNLAGVTTEYWGQLKGYGIYCQNLYAIGEFRMKNGRDVMMEFEVLENKFRSEFSSLRSEISSKDNYLQNASFTLSLNYWQSTNDIRLFTATGKLLYFNNNFYSEKRSVSEIVRDNGRTVLRIKNNNVKQVNSDFFDRPKDNTICYISFHYKCIRGGNLTIGCMDKSLYFTERVDVSTDYAVKEFSAEWDGTGDFVVSFTGEIYIYGLALTNNKLADLEYKLTTRILQTEESISAIATRVSAIETASSGWLTTADGNLLWAAIRNKLDANSNLISIINQTPYSTLIASSHINLNGAVSYSSLTSDLQTKFNMIDDMARDDKLTPNEKQLIAKEYTTILEEYKVLKAKADSCTNTSFNSGVKTQWSGYYSAYSHFCDNMFYWLMYLDSTSSIDAGTFRKTFADYYSSKEALSSELSFYDACIAKNDVAIKIGYGSFADMVTQASLGKTFIKGGLINTELLAANTVLADKIASVQITTSKITVQNSAKIGGFTVIRNYLYWNQNDAIVSIGYNTDGYGQTPACIMARSSFNGTAIAGIASSGGAAIYGSCRSYQTYPTNWTLCAGYFDGDLLVQAGNVLCDARDVSGKGVIQGGSVRSLDGWSGSFKGKSVEVKGGIITNVW